MSENKSITDFLVGDVLCFTYVMKFPYNFLNHDSLFSHFSFFLQSTEILKLLCGKNNNTIITLPCCVSWFASVLCDLMINPGTAIKCVCSTVVGYHNACGGLP